MPMSTDAMDYRVSANEFFNRFMYPLPKFIDVWEEKRKDIFRFRATIQVSGGKAYFAEALVTGSYLHSGKSIGTFSDVIDAVLTKLLREIKAKVISDGRDSGFMDVYLGQYSRDRRDRAVLDAQLGDYTAKAIAYTYDKMVADALTSPHTVTSSGESISSTISGYGASNNEIRRIVQEELKGMKQELIQQIRDEVSKIEDVLMKALDK